MTTLDAALAQARAYAAHSYSANTHAAYASDWKLFSAWCATQQRRPLPATPETILCYVVSLAQTLSMATIDRRLRGIAFHHRQARAANPTDDPEVVVTLRGLRRTKGVAPQPKTPLSVEQLRRIVAALPHDLRGAQSRAVLLLGFAGAFRRSELVALQLDDLAWVSQGLIVTIQRSKTDQEGEGFTKGIPYGSHPETCPVVAIGHWLKLSGLARGPVFRALTSQGRIQYRPMPAYTVARILQRGAEAIGLDPREYGGHSLRAGLVTAAAKAGVSERVLMAQTGHRDVRTLRRYIRDASLFAENAAAHVGL
jgi:integrase